MKVPDVVFAIQKELFRLNGLRKCAAIVTETGVFIAVIPDGEVYGVNMNNPVDAKSSDY